MKPILRAPLKVTAPAWLMLAAAGPLWANGPVSSGAAMQQPETPAPAASTAANTARDGDIAIREEFDRAAELDTPAAWELFIARHPGHALADQARDRLRELQGSD